MASGVAVHDECKTAYQETKLGHKYRYLIFSITPDNKQIIVLKKAEPNATYEDFKDDLKEAEKAQECRYAVYDAEYTAKDGQPRSKIVMFMWNPETAKLKQRMIYASSKDALKKALGEGIAKEIQANDHGDLEWNSVLEVIQRTERV